jgi:hypothetical protein
LQRAVASLGATRLALAPAAERLYRYPDGLMTLSRFRTIGTRVVGVIAFVGFLAMVLEFWSEGRAGTLFDRYQNWRHQWISHGEAMVGMGLSILVLTVFGVLSWLERRREQRLSDKAPSRERAG